LSPATLEFAFHRIDVTTHRPSVVLYYPLEVVERKTLDPDFTDSLRGIDVRR
jgi:hypothetical protein